MDVLQDVTKHQGQPMSERDGDWLDRIGDTLSQLGWLDDTMRNAIVREVREVLDRDDGSDGPAVTLLRGGRADDGHPGVDLDDGDDDLDGMSGDDLDDVGLFDVGLDIGLDADLGDGPHDDLGDPSPVGGPRRFTVYARHDADNDPHVDRHGDRNGARHAASDARHGDVRLLTTPPMPLRSRPRRSLGEGQIRLPADPDVWQTLLHGTRPATYRVHCDQGELHVAVDGDLVVRLEEGQSTDVEGACVRVRACGSGESEGRFLRLS